MAEIRINGRPHQGDGKLIRIGIGPGIVGPLEFFELGVKDAQGNNITLRLNRDEACEVADWLKEASQGEWA